MEEARMLDFFTSGRVECMERCRGNESDPLAKRPSSQRQLWLTDGEAISQRKNATLLSLIPGHSRHVGRITDNP